MRSYLANASWSMPQGETPFEAGSKWGQAVSQVGKAVKDISETSKAADKEQFLSEQERYYLTRVGQFKNGPQSRRSEIMAAIASYSGDPVKAARYAQRASEEKTQETRAGQAKSVAEAYRRAPTEAPVEGVDSAAIDAEIKAIENELRVRSMQMDIGYTRPESGPTPEFSFDRGGRR